MRKGIIIGSIFLCLGAAAAAVWVLSGRPASGAQPPDQAVRLFREHGWRVDGEVSEQRITLPPDAPTGSAPSMAAPPWLWLAGLSREAGLDFAPYAGQEVRSLSFPVRDAKGERLSQYRLVASMLMHEQDGMIGAWLCAPEEQPGEIKAGEFRCYTLEGEPARR